jgi:cold shock CspA family protein
MATGKIVRFDRMRGYGFIAPDTGGEDVFVHANELEAEGATATVGSRVGFEVVEGERGLKAYDVRLLGREVAPVSPAGGPVNGAVNGSLVNGARPAVATPHGAAEDDEEWDVLEERQFVGQVTELLITASPALTASQIMEIRHALVGMARSHGWVD